MSEVKKQVVRITTIVTYSSDQTAKATQAAKLNGSLVGSAAEIIARMNDGYDGIFTIIEPDLPSAGGLNDHIIEALTEVGYEVMLS